MKRSTKKLCLICGRPEDEHHDFEAKKMPDGCQCDEGSWGDAVAPICDKYMGVTYCEICEHDRACHK